MTFGSTSASVYLHAVINGYDTGSRETINGDIKGTISYRNGSAATVGFTSKYLNSEVEMVNFDIVAGGTSGSILVYGTGSRYYLFGATVTTQTI
jgi:hypothetical protein